MHWAAPTKAFAHFSVVGQGQGNSQGTTSYYHMQLCIKYPQREWGAHASLGLSYNQTPIRRDAKISLPSRNVTYMNG